MSERKPILLRIDPAVHDALARWAADDFRSLNAHLEMLLRKALVDAGRMPKKAGPMPKRGRPPTADGS
ncbi:MAG TPA: DNA-binding protein [Acidimicrobiales bacterium]|nr:DNA-binding protein [Acidimicrobiales bacterium]